MTKLSSIKQLLHDGLSLARERISTEGGFNPFGIVLVDESYQVVEGVEIGDKGLDGIIYTLKEKVKKIDAEAIVCCADTIVVPSGETVRMNAIEALIESSEQCVRGYQLYGKNLEGELVFTPFEAEEVESLIFK